MNEIKKQDEVFENNNMDIEKTSLNIENIENSEAQYLLELEAPMGESLKAKLEKVVEKKIGLFGSQNKA